MQWIDETRIETPEQIDVALELAGVGSRFMARAFDWLVQAVGLIVGALVGLMVITMFSVAYPQKALGMLFMAVCLGIAFVCWLSYDIYCEVWHNGQTLGKRIAGVRVIREGGAPVDFRSSCIRNLLWVADFLPSFYLLGGLLVTFTPRHQRLGDMAAGTLVIRERVLRPPADVSKLVEEFAAPEYTFTARQLAACAPEDRHILRSFFQRYHDMEPRARDRLARRMAATLVEKTAFGNDGPAIDAAEADAFLAGLYRDLESAVRQGD